MRNGRDPLHIEDNHRQAKRHPVRTKILALIDRDRLRPLAVDVLAADLLAEFPDLKAEDAKPARIAYHLAVLKEAELLPAEGC
jgi:DNA-binding transcriptional ArsR family regulator